MPTSDAPGLYRLWKIEKSIWLEGQSAMRQHVLPDALIVPSAPLPPQRFKALIEAVGDARPFESVDMTERDFLETGNTVIISYKAIAKHQKFRRNYIAQCTTTYVSQGDGWRVACHNHVRLS